NQYDISNNEIRIMHEDESIHCEDTQRTRKLMTYYKNDTPLKSYHDFNKEEVTESLIEDMKHGKTYALVTDAGMPVISDPGFELVSGMQDEGLSYCDYPADYYFTEPLVASYIGHNDYMSFVIFYL